MEQPPHPMRLGDDEGVYYRGEFTTVPEPATGPTTATTGEVAR
jgi:NADH-quinone oxidoreductase subunit I